MEYLAMINGESFKNATVDPKEGELHQTEATRNNWWPRRWNH